MTKEQILEKINNKEAKSIAEVAQWINTMTIYIPEPTRLKKGDVFAYKSLNKNRPFVVVKNIGSLVLSIPLTSTKDDMSIGSYNSRFFGAGYFGKQLICVKKNQASMRLIGVLDDNNSINNAYNLIKQLIN